MFHLIPISDRQSIHWYSIRQSDHPLQLTYNSHSILQTVFQLIYLPDNSYKMQHPSVFLLLQRTYNSHNILQTLFHLIHLPNNSYSICQCSFYLVNLQLTQHSSNTVPVNSLPKQFIQHLPVFLLLRLNYNSHILQTLFHYLTYSNSHPSQRTNQGTSPLKDTVTGPSVFHAAMYGQLLRSIQARHCFLTSSFQNKLVIGF